ncbi:MAG: thioredoxin family protein [Planctomycetota bacterium]
MFNKLDKRVLSLFAAALVALATTSVRAGDRQEAENLPPIYDTKADGEKQIADALTAAKSDGRRVLLQFGANWCIWCHWLHTVLTTDPKIAKVVKDDYLLVLIDIDDVDGKRHNDAIDERFGRPTKSGVPAWIVLNANGKMLASVNTEAMEKGKGYDNEKVLATLKQYGKDHPAAEAHLAAATAEAKAQSKNLLVYFSAPWCEWCKRLDAYFARPEVSKALASSFAIVRLDLELNPGASEIAAKYGRGEKDGLPFFLILDASGKQMADSFGPKGNCGFPVETFEVEHFMSVLKTTGKYLDADKLRTLEGSLKSEP